MKGSLVAGLAALSFSTAASAALVGPVPYLAPADSPFASNAFVNFVLETFDGATQPGYTRSAGSILGPATLTDSVGGSGSSLYSNGAKALTFDFTPYFNLHGYYPNRAGIVWTDVGYLTGECCGPFSGVGLVQFAAYAPGGTLIGSTSATLGDGTANGGTAEDRFFGVLNNAGIKQLVIEMPNSDDWEVDHLQFGSAVPEPASWAMLIAGFGLVGAVARRRRAFQAPAT